MPGAELVADIGLLVAELPTYGYRRIHAVLRRQAEQTGCVAHDPKRVYRVMIVHGLLLRRSVDQVAARLKPCARSRKR